MVFSAAAWLKENILEWLRVTSFNLSELWRTLANFRGKSLYDCDKFRRSFRRV